MNKQQLAALFRKLGAADPDIWAQSQIEEGIPQLARYVFLRQAWRSIVAKDDSSWIANVIAHADAHPDQSHGGVGDALKRLRARGATDEELTDLVRGMQAELLFSFCYLLEDPGDLEPEVADMAWALVQIDEAGHVMGKIIALHESVSETDPAGR